MQRCERRIAGFHQVIMLVRRKVHIERHQAVVQERVDRARRLDRKLRIKFYRVLQIAQALLQQRPHLLQTRSSRERAFPRCVVFLL